MFRSVPDFGKVTSVVIGSMVTASVDTNHRPSKQRSVSNKPCGTRSYYVIVTIP